MHRQCNGSRLLHDLTEDDLARYLIHAVQGIKLAASTRQHAAFRRKMRTMVAIVIKGGLADE